MPHYNQNELDQAEERYKEGEERKYRKQLRKQAEKWNISKEFLESCQPWIQQNRAPTIEEYSQWARGQHKRACKEYYAAYPIDYHNGQCSHMIHFNKPCVSFFSHTGICETGYFVPERILNIKWPVFNKRARKAAREVKKELHGG